MIRNVNHEDDVNRFQSVHDNYYEDRIWAFECKSMPVNETETLTCQYSGYVNDYDQVLVFDVSNILLFFRFSTCNSESYVLS